MCYTPQLEEQLDDNGHNDGRSMDHQEVETPHYLVGRQKDTRLVVVVVVVVMMMTEKYQYNNDSSTFIHFELGLQIHQHPTLGAKLLPMFKQPCVFQPRLEETCGLFTKVASLVMISTP